MAAAACLAAVIGMTTAPTAAASAPDSSQGRDPFAPVQSQPAAPGAAAVDAAPPMEAVKLSSQAAFTNTSPRVGDSLDYVLQVEWKDTQVPVVVMAPDSLSFPGFKILGQATVHKKLATAQEVRNHTEFVYRLRAETQGGGRASSLKLRYLTGISKQEEAVFIPTTQIDILPAPVNLMDMVWFKALMCLILLGVAGFLAWMIYRLTLRFQAKTSQGKVHRKDFKSDITALKVRIRTAGAGSPEASKDILLEMEKIGVAFLQQETAQPGQARFEPLLEGYLARYPASGNGGADGSDAQDWARMRELFRHARFAGGHKEPHELQDAFRTLKKCLKITGEDEND